MLQEPKKHHYIPVFYLKRWCDCDGKVHAVRNLSGRIIRNKRAPKYLCFEENLYSYNQDFQTENRAKIETNFFKPLDSEVARIVSQMIQGKMLADSDIVLWATFLLSMRVRTPNIVDKLKNEGQRVLTRELESAKREYDELTHPDDLATPLDWIRVNHPGLLESVGVGQLPKIASYPRAMQDLLSFSWHIVKYSASALPLLTSDRPCVYTEGLQGPNCIVTIPLSPRHAFFSFRPNSRAQESIMQSPPNRLSKALNRSVVGQAALRAFSQKTSDAPDRFFSNCLINSTDTAKT